MVGRQRLHVSCHCTRVNDAGACTCGKADCASPAKHPIAGLVPHGLKDASADLEIVRGWFAEAYWANYGVATDPFMVIDIDVKHGGVERWREMCAQTTPAAHPHLDGRHRRRRSAPILSQSGRYP